MKKLQKLADKGHDIPAITQAPKLEGYLVDIYELFILLRKRAQFTDSGTPLPISLSDMMAGIKAFCFELLGLESIGNNIVLLAAMDTTWLAIAQQNILKEAEKRKAEVEAKRQVAARKRVSRRN